MGHAHSTAYSKMADLKRAVGDTLAKVLPLFNTNSVSQAVKYEAQGCIRHIIREMGRHSLCNDMQLVKSRFEAMLSVIDSMECQSESSSSFSAPRPQTGMYVT